LNNWLGFVGMSLFLTSVVIFAVFEGVVSVVWLRQ